jgi:hypothetical protein
MFHDMIDHNTIFIKPPNTSYKTQHFAYTAVPTPHMRINAPTSLLLLAFAHNIQGEAGTPRRGACPCMMIHHCRIQTTTADHQGEGFYVLERLPTFQSLRAHSSKAPRYGLKFEVIYYNNM